MMNLFLVVTSTQFQTTNNRMADTKQILSEDNVESNVSNWEEFLLFLTDLALKTRKIINQCNCKKDPIEKQNMVFKKFFV